MRNNNMNKEVRNLRNACNAYENALQLIENVNKMCENIDAMPVGKEFRCKDVCPINYQLAAAYLNRAVCDQRFANRDYGIEDCFERRITRMTVSLPADIQSAEDLEAYLSNGNEIEFTPVLTEVHIFKKTR